VTMLWASLIVGAAVAATIALAALDHQRRLFLASNAKEPDGGPKSAGAADDRRGRVRHALSKIREFVIRSMAAPGVRQPAARRRREHAARIILRTLSQTAAAPANVLPAKPPETTALSTDSPTGPQPAGDPLASGASAAEGIVRIDRGGLLRFADPIARDLLHWSSGDLTLSAILGERETAAMMAALTRQEVVEQTVTVRTGASAERLHATALASRGSDGSLLGALLFLRRL
jgi:PAS domain-containing protein